MAKKPEPIVPGVTQRKKVAKHPTRRAQLVTMSVEQWYYVPDNPAQPRDKYIRAPKAKHLHKFKPGLHEHAWAARLPDGSLRKLDVHCRSVVWFYGLSDYVPDKIYVHIIDVKDENEAADLCGYYDSRQAARKTEDLYHGALSWLDVPMTSPFMQTSRNIAAAASYAYERVRKNYLTGNKPELRKLAAEMPVQDRATEIDKVELFTEELAMLDSLGIGNNPRKQNNAIFRGPMIMAALMAAKRYGPDRVKPFFEQLLEGDRGERKGGKCNPIQFVEELMSTAPKTAAKVGANKLGGRTEHEKRCRRILGAIDIFMSGPADKVAARDDKGRSVYNAPVTCSKHTNGAQDLDSYLITATVRRPSRAKTLTRD